MPQASDELRAAIVKRFGSIEPDGPELWLKGRGYVLTSHWDWMKPSIRHSVTDDEWQCIQFLIHEWDYGDLA